MRNLGWPIDQGQLKAIVFTFLQKTKLNNPLKNDTPGDEGCESFQTHWKSQLSQRKPEYVTVACAKRLDWST